MSQLMEKNSQGTITADEFHELSELVEWGQRLTLQKSQAMRLLLEGDCSVSLNDLKPVHD
jgi:hypothetical protein